MTTIVLPQYGQRRVQMVEADARRLELDSGTALRVEVDQESGWWNVRAEQFVGTIVSGDVKVLIQPKIPPDNLLILLEVGIAPSDWAAESFDYAVTGDLLPSLVSFFVRTADSALGRGVLRSYVPMREPVGALRGRLDFPALIAHPGQLAPIPCEFEEHSVDTFENRYLRAAIRRSLRIPMVRPHDRRRLLQLLSTLDGVSDVHVDAAEIDRLVTTRLNAHYVPALRLARLILDNSTLLDEIGTTSASAFLVDMNKLFERFVTARLQRALRGDLDVVAEPPVHLGVGKRLLMKPDLVFRRRGDTVFVADCKYKLSPTGLGRNADYYQMLAYATALGLDEGLLIYCFADGASPDKTLTVAGSGHRLQLHALDLSGSSADIDAAIAVLAQRILDSTRSPANAT